MVEDDIPAEEIKKAFMFPKYATTVRIPCVQVCPVGATYETRMEWFLLIMTIASDAILHSGCPYGARYFNTEKGTADKCTWCYHRITKASYLHVSGMSRGSPEIW
jgi:Fe-S-cluster-containing dehydrogenase component